MDSASIAVEGFRVVRDAVKNHASIATMARGACNGGFKGDYAVQHDGKRRTVAAFGVLNEKMLGRLEQDAAAICPADTGSVNPRRTVILATLPGASEQKAHVDGNYNGAKRTKGSQGCVVLVALSARHFHVRSAAGAWHQVKLRAGDAIAFKKSVTHKGAALHKDKRPSYAAYVAVGW